MKVNQSFKFFKFCRFSFQTPKPQFLTESTPLLPKTDKPKKSDRPKTTSLYESEPNFKKLEIPLFWFFFSFQTFKMQILPENVLRQQKT